MFIGANHGVVQAADEIFNAQHPAAFDSLDTPDLEAEEGLCCERLRALWVRESAASRDMTFASVAPMLVFFAVARFGPGAWLMPGAAVALALCFAGNLWGQVRVARIRAKRELMAARLEIIRRHLLNRSDWHPSC